MLILNTRIDFFRERPGMVIAELGVFKGDFSRQLLEYNPETLWMVDTWSGAMSCGDKDGRNIVNVADMADVYKVVTFEFSKPNVIVYRGASTDFLSFIEDDTLDCVYIDTTHEYEMTLHELMLSRGKVKPGGWVTGHDYNVSSVANAVNEFCELYSLTIEYLTEDGNPSFYIRNVK